MPRVNLMLYREDDDRVPLLEWFLEQPERVQDRCLVRMEPLGHLGHEIRRPEADLLRDDIYELRVGIAGWNYRILYFFHGRNAIVLSHGLEKEARVPSGEIDLAIIRRKKFIANPALHSADFQLIHGEDELE